MRTEQFKKVSTPTACAVFKLFQMQSFCGKIRKKHALGSDQFIN
jgi:hypothetical protein